MKFIYWVFITILVFLILYVVLAIKYKNPFKLILIFGKKGSGKSTYLTKLAYKYQKKKWKVYSTEPIPGCYMINHDDIGFVEISENSLLLIDEIGMIWHARDFKKFKPEVRNWFKLQRHYKVKVVCASQVYDIDKSLRQLVDEMYLFKCIFNVFSYGKRINKKLVLTESTSEAPSTISEDLIFDSFLLFWCGSRILTFIPKWSKYFDSFAAPKLKVVPFPQLPGFRIKKSPVKVRLEKWLSRTK